MRFSVIVALLISAPAWAGSPITSTSTGNAASEPVVTVTGTGGSSYSTNAIPVFLASQIIIRCSSTTAARCSLATVQVSNDSTNWITAPGAMTDELASGSATLGALTATSFGGTPLVSTFQYTIAGAVIPIPTPWRWMRVVFTFGSLSPYATLANFTIQPIVLRNELNGSIWQGFY